MFSVIWPLNPCLASATLRDISYSWPYLNQQGHFTEGFRSKYGNRTDSNPHSSKVTTKIFYSWYESYIPMSFKIISHSDDEKLIRNRTKSLSHQNHVWKIESGVGPRITTSKQPQSAIKCRSVYPIDYVQWFVISGLSALQFLVNWYDSMVHPCEKVIGIFFRHNFFTIYFLLFVLLFILNICEVVNIKSTDFCCISIICYTSVIFWKRLLGQNPMSH